MSRIHTTPSNRLLLLICVSFQLPGMQKITTEILLKPVWGYSSRQGTRRTMEDTHTAISSFNKITDAGFFAIYDGHNSSEVSQYAADNLHEYCLEYRKLNSNGSPTEAVIHAIKMVEKDINKRNLRGGSTALIAYNENNLLRLFCMGDSRALVVRGDSIVTETTDHKPSKKFEKERIEQAGGKLIFDGVLRNSGGLSVSRGLGNTEIKKDKKNGFIATPDIQQIGLEEKDVVIMACDGVWDVMESSTVAKFVNTLHHKTVQDLEKEYPNQVSHEEIMCEEGDKRLALIARALRDTAFYRRSSDNISVLVTQFQAHNTIQK